MASQNSFISEHQLREDCILYTSPFTNILIGCPPEILKLIYIKHLPMPDTVIIPGTLYKSRSSQVSIEFPFYHFLFIQQGLTKGKKFKVLAKKETCRSLKEMLRVTLLGPNIDEVQSIEKNLNLPQQLDIEKVQQIMKEIRYLALKNKDGEILQINDLIEFIPLEIDELYKLEFAQNVQAPIIISRKSENDFQIQCGNDTFLASLKIKTTQAPTYELLDKKISNAEIKSKTIFSVRVIGASDGFDPTQPSNGYLLHINGKWLLWDCPPYMHLHLEKLGLAFDDIDGLIVSHVHEDHLDIVESFRSPKKLDIYTSPEIFHCMLLKVMMVLNCDFKTAADKYTFHPIYVGKEFDLFGGDFEIFYSVHSIPSLGLKLKMTSPKGKISKFFISGDTLSYSAADKLSAANVFSSTRKKEINHFIDDDDYDLAFVDTANGLTHGDPKDYIKCKSNVYYMHTGLKIDAYPKHHRQLKTAQVFVLHK